MIDKIAGRICHVINGQYPNTTTYYEYFNMSQDEMKYFTLQFVIENTTITLEVTNDTSPNGSGYWTDITDAMTGETSFTESGMWIIDTPLVVRRCRVKCVTTNDTNALDLYLTRGD